jgi:hypothetical protein
MEKTTRAPNIRRLPDNGRFRSNPLPRHRNIGLWCCQTYIVTAPKIDNRPIRPTSGSVLAVFGRRARAVCSAVPAVAAGLADEFSAFL